MLLVCSEFWHKSCFATGQDTNNSGFSQLLVFFVSLKKESRFEIMDKIKKIRFVFGIMGLLLLGSCGDYLDKTTGQGNELVVEKEYSITQRQLSPGVYLNKFHVDAEVLEDNELILKHKDADNNWKEQSWVENHAVYQKHNSIQEYKLFLKNKKNGEERLVSQENYSLKTPDDSQDINDDFDFILQMDSLDEFVIEYKKQVDHYSFEFFFKLDGKWLKAELSDVYEYAIKIPFTFEKIELKVVILDQNTGLYFEASSKLGYQGVSDGVRNKARQ